MGGASVKSGGRVRHAITSLGLLLLLLLLLLLAVALLQHAREGLGGGGQADGGCGHCALQHWVLGGTCVGGRRLCLNRNYNGEGWVRDV